MTRQRGQALLEFALMIPSLFFLLALPIDLFRVDWVTTTVAEAARQGARQAVANADPYDNPFGTAGGACSGTTQVNAANGSGCLTSARIYQTVTNVLGGCAPRPPPPPPVPPTHPPHHPQPTRRLV